MLFWSLITLSIKLNAYIALCIPFRKKKTTLITFFFFFPFLSLTYFYNNIYFCAFHVFPLYFRDVLLNKQKKCIKMFLFISTSFDILKCFWSLESLLSQHVWLFYIFIAAYCIFSFFLLKNSSFNLHIVFLSCLLRRLSAVDKVFKSWPLRFI